MAAGSSPAAGVSNEQAFPAHGNAAAICPAPNGKGYMINVASYRNSIGYDPWVRIDGLSEQVLRFIAEHEAMSA
jgi:hypothetical protein